MSWLEAVGVVLSRAEAADVVFFEAVHSYAMAALEATGAFAHCIDAIIVITKLESIQSISNGAKTPDCIESINSLISKDFCSPWQATRTPQKRQSLRSRLADTEEGKQKTTQSEQFTRKKTQLLPSDLSC
ncbi:protein of unknown function [Pseudomonas sp. JV551A1]|uniref:hypothetical protein n=1 Tax=Pseudomonas sp. JV551A1 TaxID=2078787 RepID=UPI00100C4647|nr:hypothetical protein [Pseudomonas sp. JV551A1]SPO53080.1 protein of unknown function [Pseudomonas sp. JV551A1]